MEKFNPTKYIGNLPYLLHQYKKFKEEEEKYEQLTGGSMFGLAAGVFLIVILISLAIWIAALVLLIQNGKRMPTWAVVVGIIFLLFPLPGGALVTLILALAVRK